MLRRRAWLVFALATTLAWGLAPAAVAVVDVSGPAAGIAVAPFSEAFSTDGESGLPDVASLLADALAADSDTRVVAPSGLLRDRRGLQDPQAADVRRWARWNGVENVIVGRTARRGRGLEVDVELRSGHSGAPKAEYRLAPESGDDVPGVVQHLARLILADLGGAVAASDSPPQVGSAPPGTETAPVDAGPDEPGAPSDGGLGMALLPGSRRDTPMAINSEELEVLPQNGGRRLVFSRDVVVLQGDVTLNADRLEAVYPQGASQPDLLLASGRVRVVQGDKRARCEEATYQRDVHTIVCRGKAEVLQGCDRVRGEQIEFDLEHERVLVTGAASVVIQSEDTDGSECLSAHDAEEVPR